MLEHLHWHYDFIFHSSQIVIAYYFDKDKYIFYTIFNHDLYTPCVLLM